VISFSAGGIQYSLAPNQSVSIVHTDADTSTDIVQLVASGILLELTVYGAKTVVPTPVETSTPVVAAPVSFTSATQSSITGNIDGITIDSSTGAWVLLNGSRMLYASSRLRQQPAAGPGSSVTIGATMQRNSIAGAFGFAIYTDGSPKAGSFANGITVHYESNGLCQIYQLQNNVWNDISNQANSVPYPMDTNEHSYAVVVQNPNSSTLNITAFVDAVPVATAVVTGGNFVTNGTIGFSTSGGCPPVLIAPNSFQFSLGVGLLQNLPIAGQAIIHTDAQGNPLLNLNPSGGAGGGQIGTLGQANNDPAVLFGSVTGTAKNLVPDSDLKFGSTLSNTSHAGALSVVPGTGLSGGKGIVFSQPTGINTSIGPLQWQFGTIAVVAGQICSLSGNIQCAGGTQGGSGLPAWELWSVNTDDSLNTRLLHADQQLGQGTPSDGKSRVKYENYTIPGGVTGVAVVAATNGVALTALTNLIFSEPQLEFGPYATAYSSNILSDQTSVVPYGTMDAPIQSGIDSAGRLNLGSPQPGVQVPLGANSSQVVSTIASSQINGTYMKPITIANSTIGPNTVTNDKAQSNTYTNTTANIFNNVSSNYSWYVPGIGAVTVANTIADGSSLIYSVNTVDPATSPAPTAETLKIAANSTITVIFNHPPYVASAPYSTKIAFTGSTASVTANVVQSASIGDSSAPSITASTTPSTTTPQYTTGFSNTGNPSITSSISSTPVNQAVTTGFSDSQTAAITSSLNSSTSNDPFTGTVGSTASTPSITSSSNTTTATISNSQVENNTSTPTITSSTGSVPTLTAESGSGSASSTAQIVPTFHANVANTQNSTATTPEASTSSITQNANTTYSNNAFTGTNTAENSTATITRVANPATYTNVATTTGANGTSTATISSTTVPGSSSQVQSTASASGSSTSSISSSADAITTSNQSNTSQASAISSTASISSTADAPVYVTQQQSSSLPTATSTATIASTADALTYSDILHSQANGDSGYSTAQISLTRSSVQQTSSGTVTTGVSTTTCMAGTSLTVNSYYRSTYTHTTHHVGTDTIDVYTSIVYTDTITITGPSSYSYTASAGLQPFSVTVPYDGVYTVVSSSSTNAVDSEDSPISGASNTNTLSITWNQLSQSYTSANGSWVNFAVSPSVTEAPVDSAHQLTLYSPSFSLHYQTGNGPLLTSDGFTGGSFSDSTGSYSVDIRLIAPNGSTVLQTWTAVTGGQTIPYYAAGVPAGVYTFQIRVTIISNTSSNTASRGVSGTSNLSWYQSDANPQTYTHTATNGSRVVIGSTPSSTLAPTSLGTAISLTPSNVTNASDSNGDTALQVELYSPSNALLATFRASTTTYTYYNSSAAAGIYTWKVFTLPVILSGSDSTTNYSTSYPGSCQATMTWYQQVATSQTYTHTASPGTLVTVGSSGSAIAPVSSSTAITFIAGSGTVLPTSSFGTGTMTLFLLNPSAIQVASFTISSTSQLCTYFNASAPAGIYTWKMQTSATPTNTDDTNNYSTTIPGTIAGTVGWYVTVNNPQTYTHTTSNGSTVAIASTGSASAPTSTSTQLSFAVGSITVPSDSNGGSSFSVQLYSPSNALLQTWTGITSTQTLTYADGSATSGVYTWKAFSIAALGSIASTANVSSSYAGSIAGTIGWYTLVTIPTTYTHSTANGATVTLASTPSLSATVGTALIPTNAGTQLSLTISGLTIPSNADGSSQFNVTLLRPDSTVAATFLSVTNGQVLTYFNASAASGVYVWKGYTSCTISGSVNNTQNISDSYSGVLTGTAQWYVSTVNPTTYVYTDTSGTTNTLTTPVSALAASSGTPHTLVLTGINCPSDANGSSALQVQLFNPNNSMVQSWTVSTNQTLTYSTAGSPAGVWTWNLTGIVTTDTHTNVASYLVQVSAQAGWYQSVGTTNYTYTVTNGSTQTLTTSNVALGPNAGTPHTLVLSGISVPSDANGSSSFTVVLKDPSSTTLNTWTGITTNQTLTWSASGPSTGTYSWLIFATASSNNVLGATYNASVNAKAGWYEAPVGGTYTYTTPSGTASTFTTDPATLAPTSSAQQLTLVLSSVVAVSNSSGTSALAVSLTDPSSAVVKTWNVTGNTTLSYSAPGAISGTYTWSIAAAITNNLNTATTTVNYANSCNVSSGWYQNVNVSVTTYTANNGSTASYPTPSGTLAPTTGALQLSFNITAITAGSNSAGSSAYSISLLRPDGSQAQHWTGVTSTQTLTYFNASDPGGIWHWSVYSYCTTTNTATATYSNSLTATAGWFESQSTTTTTYSNNVGALSSFVTDPTTIAPTSPATQLSFNISSLTAGSNANGSSTWTVILKDSSATTRQTWAGLTASATLTWYQVAASAGQYTWTVQSFCTNTGTAIDSYGNHIAGTLTWYQAVTTTSTQYNTANGVPSAYATPSGTVAPVSVGTQLTFQITAISTISNSAGTGSYNVTLQNSAGTQVQAWSSITTTQTLSYSNGSAIGGSYTWNINAVVVKSGSPTTGNYAATMTSTVGWYILQATGATVYSNNASTSTSTASTDPTTLAPINSGLQLSFTPSSITLPSDSKGATTYNVSLKSPTGTVIQSWPVTNTTPITYFNSAAVAGSYSWVIQAQCTNTGTGTETYTTMISGTIGWHQTLNSTILTCTNHDGNVASYSTPANTVAPAASGTQLTLSLDTVITPSNSQGTSSIAVLLYDPTNTLISAITTTGITSSRTIHYFNGSAIAGSYTWVVWGQCSNNGTGASTYAVSWSGSHSWYQPQTSNAQVYILANDNFTQRISVADSNVDFQTVSPSQVQFQITNSASSALTFTLGVISTGF
jgi:hypothetical protein